MNVNDLFVGTAASSFERHPNGDFDAKVMDVVMVKPEGKSPFLKLILETKFGRPPEFRYTIITENDLLRCQHDPEFKKTKQNQIGIHKAVMVKLGLVDDTGVIQWDQNRLISAYAYLKNRTIRITVADDAKDPKYQRVTITGMAAENQFQSNPPSESLPKASTNYHINQNGFQPSQNQFQSPPGPFVGMGLPNGSHDDIPF